MRLVAFWRSCIGSLEELWSLSPKEVDAVIQEFLGWQDVKHMRAGTIASAAWNAVRANKKRKSWTVWTDSPLFVENNKRRGLTHAEMLQQAREMVASTHR